MEIVAQLTANSLIAASIYALIALGFNLIYGVTKFFNLAHGAMITLGGYGVFFLGKKLGLEVWLAIGLGIIIAGLIGYLLDRLVYRPLRNRKASTMIQLVASLGLITAIQAGIAIVFSTQFQTLATRQARVFEVLGASITSVQVSALLVAFLVTVFLAFVLSRTTFGKTVRAISDDDEVAKIVGINTERVIGYTFFIGSAIAGLAGIIFGFDTGIDPSMGLPLLLSGITAAIIGGVGNIYGSLLGALILGFIENFGIWFIAAEWKNVITFAVLILFLIFRPQGIFKK